MRLRPSRWGGLGAWAWELRGGSLACLPSPRCAEIGDDSSVISGHRGRGSSSSARPRLCQVQTPGSCNQSIKEKTPGSWTAPPTLSVRPSGFFAVSRRGFIGCRPVSAVWSSSVHAMSDVFTRAARHRHTRNRRHQSPRGQQDDSNRPLEGNLLPRHHLRTKLCWEQECPVFGSRIRG